MAQPAKLRRSAETPGSEEHGKDPLAAILKATADAARQAKLTDAEIDAELAAYNAERRD